MAPVPGDVCQDGRTQISVINHAEMVLLEKNVRIHVVEIVWTIKPVIKLTGDAEPVLLDGRVIFVIKRVILDGTV